MQMNKRRREKEMEDDYYTVAVVAGRQFCAPYPIELTVEKIGANFIITDSNGITVLTMLALNSRCFLQDARGTALLTMEKKKLSIHRRWEAYKGNTCSDKKLLFSAKKSSVFQLKTALDVFLLSNFDEKYCDFHVTGSYLERKCEFYQGKGLVAEMKRKYTGTNLLLDKDTFVVVVEPGVDCAFIVSLVVILDQITTNFLG